MMPSNGVSLNDRVLIATKYMQGSNCLMLHNFNFTIMNVESKNNDDLSHHTDNEKTTNKYAMTEDPTLSIYKVLIDRDLEHYFRLLVDVATNIRNPYHNLRHMLHVTLNCDRAAKYYNLSDKDTRVILLAAIFHDFNHSGGKLGDDAKEITNACNALDAHCLPKDQPLLPAIKKVIGATQYPHKEIEEPTLLQKIMRDADVCQGFSIASLQQVTIGLATESGLSIREFLPRQYLFTKNVHFVTQWGKETFECQRPRFLDDLRQFAHILRVTLPE